MFSFLTTAVMQVLLLGAALYYPIDGPAADDLERLAALTDMPALAKPVSAALIRDYLPRIEESDPELFLRISRRLGPLESPGGSLGTLDAETRWQDSNPDDPAKTLPNAHGRTLGGFGSAEVTAYVSPHPAVRASLNGSLDRKGDAYRGFFDNTYVALGWDWAQIDLGFRDHWFSPATGGAIAMGTNAWNSPSVTVSSARPLSRYSLGYELLYSDLEKTDSIYYQDALHHGRPKLVGFRFDLSPMPWLTLGANRMIQFAGGPRKVTFRRVLDAIVHPARYDNSDSDLTKDDEVGNQIGSICMSANFRVGATPFRVYWDMGADDTGSQKIYYFGNPLTITGIYFPALGERLSLRYEFSEGQNGWYEHFIYRDGYRNLGDGLGSWIYDENVAFGYQIAARMHELRLVHAEEDRSVSLAFRTLRIQSYPGISPHAETPPVSYRDGAEGEVSYRWRLHERVEGGVSWYAGATPSRQMFSSIAFGVTLDLDPSAADAHSQSAGARSGVRFHDVGSADAHSAGVRSHDVGSADAHSAVVRSPDVGSTGSAAPRPSTVVANVANTELRLALGGGRAEYDFVEESSADFSRDLIDVGLGVSRPMGDSGAARLGVRGSVLAAPGHGGSDSYSLLALDFVHLTYAPGGVPFGFQGAAGLLRVSAPVNELALAWSGGAFVRFGQVHLTGTYRLTRFEVDYEPLGTGDGTKYDLRSWNIGVSIPLFTPSSARSPR
ncbi:MAG: capsule assembly Wzi family protein [Candidatus Eisenbacteria bacterium]